MAARDGQAVATGKNVGIAVKKAASKCVCVCVFLEEKE